MGARAVTLRNVIRHWRGRASVETASDQLAPHTPPNGCRSQRFADRRRARKRTSERLRADPWPVPSGGTMANPTNCAAM